MSSVASSNLRESFHMDGWIMDVNVGPQHSQLQLSGHVKQTQQHACKRLTMILCCVQKVRVFYLSSRDVVVSYIRM